MASRWWGTCNILDRYKKKQQQKENEDKNQNLLKQEKRNEI
jgi:hypothetical protein